MTLRMIALVLAVLAAGGALLAMRSAPAVTVALLAGLVAAVIAYQIGRTDGPRRIPAEVAWWFTVGIVVGGLLGILLTRPRTTWPMMRWLAVSLTIAIPFACAALALSPSEACPLYVTNGSGLCYHSADVLGDWHTVVVIFLGMSLLVIVS